MNQHRAAGNLRIIGISDLYAQLLFFEQVIENGQRALDRVGDDQLIKLSFIQSRKIT